MRSATSNDGLQQMSRYGIDDLRKLVRRLRDPCSGCPWDLRQDHASLLQHMLEEVYEFVDAVGREDDQSMCDELGDYLFQAIFHAQVAAERGAFDFDDVTHAIVSKLLRRHPHVFPDGTLGAERGADVHVDERALRTDWERGKQQERHQRAQHGVLDEVPLALPALQRAAKLQRRAASVGFDWSAVVAVIGKLREELAELEEAHHAQDGAAIAEELGDLLFSCVNLARHLDVDAESALRGANAKFERRFRALEQEVDDRGIALQGCDERLLDDIWELVKWRERGSGG